MTDGWNPYYRPISFFFMSLLLGTMFCAGCLSSTNYRTPADQYGRTYYIDGAGNWGFGVADVLQGLHDAGYQGHIINYRWSPTFNPALDQTIGRPAARASGRELGQQINEYLQDFPDNEVNIIALSAGTGVAVWACENLSDNFQVHNVIMLGSSLSSDYDMRKAMDHIKTGVL